MFVFLCKLDKTFNQTQPSLPSKDNRGRLLQQTLHVTFLNHYASLFLCASTAPRTDNLAGKGTQENARKVPVVCNYLRHCESATCSVTVTVVGYGALARIPVPCHIAHLGIFSIFLVQWNWRVPVAESTVPKVWSFVTGRWRGQGIQ